MAAEIGKMVARWQHQYRRGNGSYVAWRKSADIKYYQQRISVGSSGSWRKAAYHRAGVT